MIRTDKIQATLPDEVGFSDTTLTGYPLMSTGNAKSNSGLKFQEGSKLVSIKNIMDCQENPDITDIQFNTLLTGMNKECGLSVCNKVIESQPDFITSLNLFPFEKKFDDTIEHKSKFVGFEIEKTNDNSICKIPWVELSFDSEVTFTIYLYNSNLPKSPIKSEEVITTAGESKIVELNWFIADDLTYKGGTFYLGYFDADIGAAKAYSKVYETANIQVSTPYFYVNPVSVDYSDTKIDISETQSESDTFGLNIGMDVYTDYTELLLRNKNVLWRAIQLQMHENALLLIMYSTRSNDTISMLKNMANLELNGSKEKGIVGTTEKLIRAINSIKNSLFYVPVIRRATLTT